MFKFKNIFDRPPKTSPKVEQKSNNYEEALDKFITLIKDFVPAQYNGGKGDYISAKIKFVEGVLSFTRDYERFNKDKDYIKCGEEVIELLKQEMNKVDANQKLVPDDDKQKDIIDIAKKVIREMNLSVS